MGTKMQTLTDNSADALGAALFGAALYAAGPKGRDDNRATARAAQSALRALLDLELEPLAAQRTALTILDSARRRAAGDDDDSKGLRVCLDLLGRVTWGEQRPLTLALVIPTRAHGTFLIWLNYPEGDAPLHWQRFEDAPRVVADYWRAATLGTIGEAFAA